MNRNNVVRFFRQGFLNKLGKNKLQGYKKRWFVLTGTVLKYYPTQDTSENNCLGVIDMGRVVSITKNKLTKHGFQISTNARTYFLGAKHPDEIDSWISILQESSTEAKRLSLSSTASSLASGRVGDELNHEYSLVGSVKSSNSSIRCSTGYDLITHGISEDYSTIGKPINSNDNIYETVGETNANKSSILVNTAQKIPLKSFDEDDNEKDALAAFKMSSIMSKLSVESLDSIDSLDSSEDSVDAVGSSFDSQLDGDILPKPHGTTYATEEMKKILQDKKPCLDLEKIASDYHLKLDKDTEYPAFDALRKFLHAIK